MNIYLHISPIAQAFAFMLMISYVYYQYWIKCNRILMHVASLNDTLTLIHPA